MDEYFAALEKLREIAAKRDFSESGTREYVAQLKNVAIAYNAAIYRMERGAVNWKKKLFKAG